jgi:hypothetical protein
MAPRCSIAPPPLPAPVIKSFIKRSRSANLTASTEIQFQEGKDSHAKILVELQNKLKERRLQALGNVVVSNGEDSEW